MLAFLDEASQSGYTVVLFFVGVSSTKQSIDRVGVRVSENNHSVPTNDLTTRHPRVIEDLRRALVRSPLLLVYDNDDLRSPHGFRPEMGLGRVLKTIEPKLIWIRAVMPVDVQHAS